MPSAIYVVFSCEKDYHDCYKWEVLGSFESDQDCTFRNEIPNSPKEEVLECVAKESARFQDLFKSCLSKDKYSRLETALEAKVYEALARGMRREKLRSPKGEQLELPLVALEEECT